MKRLFFIVIICLPYIANAQIINIPDAVFKAKLLTSNAITDTIARDSSGNFIKIDSNSDGEIQTNEALKVYDLKVTSSKITSLIGISSFSNLQILDCTGDSIISLDVSALNNLRQLITFNNKKLTSLNISGLTNLQILRISSCKIDTLNLTGLNNLTQISCGFNKLTTLDARGFSKLTNLSCGSNQLSSLYVNGLTKLKALSCESNTLTSLDVSGLDSLQYLRYNNNHITNLNLNHMSKLISLDCGNNQLTTLPAINKISNLSYLYCDRNQLTDINVDSLTHLVELICNNNLLTNLKLADSSDYFKTLICDYNLLTTLNFSGCRNFAELSCNNNKISNLDFSGLPKITYLDCSYNQISSLDLTNLKLLKDFSADSNQLRNLYIKNGKYDPELINVNHFIIDHNAHLQNICADESDIPLVNSILSEYHYNNITVNSFCNSTASGTRFTLNANAKYDAENNGCSASDPICPFLKFNIKNAADSGYVVTNAQGNMSITTDSGTFTFTPEVNTSYFSVAPMFAVVTLPQDTLPIQFCITSVGQHHNISVNIIPMRAARPGFSDATYKIVLANKGNEIEDGLITFNFDGDKQQFISATQTPFTTSNGQLTFKFSSLQVFEIRETTITMRINAPSDTTSVNVGDILILSVQADLDTARDENYKNNFSQIKQTVLGSMDPNDKTCLEGDIVIPTLIGDYVNYLIRFENTGTAVAENISVTDLIDESKFDINSIELTSASHACKIIKSNGNKVQFIFDNINLPFTEPDKHGYVAFKIKTKNNLIIGDSLKNKADIYFDYNLPVATNTAASRIDNVTTTKPSKNSSGKLNILPNPNNGNFTIDFVSKGNYPITITLFDVTGKIVYTQLLQHQNQSLIQISDAVLPSGIYNVQISSKNDIWNKKVMITK